MEGKSSKPAFDKANPKQEKPKRNYSHKKLMRSIDAYASVAKTAQHKKEMLDIKDNYVLDKEKANADRTTQRINLRQGYRAGIHHRSAMGHVENNERQADQQNRNKTMDKAKSYYHRNYSLSKNFKAVAKDKDKTMDKG